jgi:hypothetical protein
MKATFVFSVIFWGVAGRALMVMAQTPGAFIAISSMNEARADHTATLLYDGKVLIVGGLSFGFSSSTPAGAELYDPSSRVFTPTSPMITPRTAHTATLLADGRVLIAGGSAGTAAELYDPSRGTFTATGDMMVAQLGWHTATLLGNGKVLIAGPGSAAQLYDPVAGTFALTAAYAEALTAGGSSHSWLETATLLPDGRVLLTGGTDAAAWTEIYDPGADSFSITGNPRAWDDVWTATSLTTGKVLFVGNEENDGLHADAEVYDPATGTFSDAGPAMDPHEYAAAALLPDGTVLIAGGQLPGGNGDVASELYVPAVGPFPAAGNMITPRHEHTATLLPDGTVLIAGGFSFWPSSTANAEVYRPSIVVSAPSLFSLSGDGKGQGAIWNGVTGQIASAANPATAGDVLSMYTTSLFENGLIPPQVAIGGRLAQILFFGDAPGYPGYNQVNFRVPNGIPPGPAVSVRLTYLSRPSNDVTIGVQ